MCTNSPSLVSKSLAQFRLEILIPVHTTSVSISFPYVPAKEICFSLMMEYRAQQFCGRMSTKHFAIQAVSADAKPGVKDSEVSSSQFEGFSVTTSTNKGDELKIGIEVSGGKTEEIFDLVFSNMVADAQPIPGFRRTKGGEPLLEAIPRDILLQVLGPSKVYREVIKKVINSTIAEYIKREGLKVSKDLRVEQSFEDLESEFEPGDAFRFDATVKLLEQN
ncbi:hypothetical protein RJ639_033962 [Escallonia herrerae]|uniref:peptidylprolyl isomerase n=1 Tax=Escallonia herrerae TaxID=1293975 RepID=A0AA89BCH5_9ASTE|nr:hypothetical protein RJ639_033962 [Escallonia herrerae]